MLVVSKPMYSLGAWDNRIRSFVNHSADAVCFYPQPGFAPEGSVHFYTSESFDESAYPELDRAASSIDVGPEADDFCGSESRIPTWYGSEAIPKLRPASSSTLGAFGDVNTTATPTCSPVTRPACCGPTQATDAARSPPVSRSVAGGTP